jgi:hypothetical protein
MTEELINDEEFKDVIDIMDTLKHEIRLKENISSLERQLEPSKFQLLTEMKNGDNQFIRRDFFSEIRKGGFTDIDIKTITPFIDSSAHPGAGHMLFFFQDPRLEGNRERIVGYLQKNYPKKYYFRLSAGMDSKAGYRDSYWVLGYSDLRMPPDNRNMTYFFCKKTLDVIAVMPGPYSKNRRKLREYTYLANRYDISKSTGEVKEECIFMKTMMGNRDPLVLVENFNDYLKVPEKLEEFYINKFRHPLSEFFKRCIERWNKRTRKERDLEDMVTENNPINVAEDSDEELVPEMLSSGQSDGYTLGSLLVDQFKGRKIA